MAENFNHWERLADALPKACSRAVRKTAFDIQARAAQAAPVDTGFLRSSIYVVTSNSSNYGQGKPSRHGGTLNIAKSLTQELLPEVEPPADEFTAFVGVGASYGIYVEFGSAHSPAQPYFIPSMEAGRAAFDAAMAAIDKRFQEAVS